MLTTLQRCYQLPVKDTEGALLPQLLKSLHSSYTDEVAAAASAVFATYRDAKLIAETIKNIVSNRRSLDIVTTNLQRKLSYYGQEFLPIVRAILSVLAIDPLTVRIQIELAVASLPWDELAQFTIELNNKKQLHADAISITINALINASRRNDIAEIINFETNLAASKDENLRRLALAALMAQTNSLLGWNQERVDRLFNYRQDTSTLVAAAAQFTFPPDRIIDNSLLSL